jgi:hypothetical protein
MNSDLQPSRQRDKLCFWMGSPAAGHCRTTFARAQGYCDRHNPKLWNHCAGNLHRQRCRGFGDTSCRRDAADFQRFESPTFPGSGFSVHLRDGFDKSSSLTATIQEFGPHEITLAVEKTSAKSLARRNRIIRYHAFNACRKSSVEGQDVSRSISPKRA